MAAQSLPTEWPQTKNLWKKLIKKKMTQCYSRLSCTTGHYSTTVISGFFPLEFKITRRAIRVYHLKVGITLPNRVLNNAKFVEELDQRCIEKWQELYNKRGSSWTKTLLPLVTDNTKEEVDFFLGQAISGHECFRSYLHRIRKIESAICPCGSGEEETPSHAFEASKRFANGRPSELQVANSATCAMCINVWCCPQTVTEENGPSSILKR